MTFARAKPLGYTDDVDVLPAAELNTIDLNQSRALDGNAGGSYAPSGAVIINGSGLQSNNILASTVNGLLTLAGGLLISSQRDLDDGASGSPARMPLRFDSTTIPSDADVTLRGPSSVADVYFGAVGSSFTASRNWTLSETGAVLDELCLIATDHNDATFNANVLTATGATVIGTFLTGSVTQRKFMLFRFNGSTWEHVVGGVGTSP